MEQILLGVQLSSEPYHPGHPQKLLELLCADSDAISLDTVSKLLAQGINLIICFCSGHGLTLRLET